MEGEKKVNDGASAVYGSEARALLARGAGALADAVAVTLGPRGRNVIIGNEYGVPTVTKDGVTVARRFRAGTGVEAMGAEMVRQASVRTAEEAGDGTTTAAVLARALIEGGMRNVAAGAGPIGLKRGIDAAVEAAVAHIGSVAVPVVGRDGIYDVARVSTNGDAELAGLVADAFAAVGPEGFVSFDEAKGRETRVEVLEGMQFDRGMLSRHFMTDPSRQECVLERPLVVVSDQRLDGRRELAPILAAFGKVGDGRSLLVVADGVGEEPLAALVVNRMRAGLRCCAIDGPSYGLVRREWLDDVAALTGATVVSPERGRDFRGFVPEWFGSADKAVVGTYSTRIIGGGGSAEAVEAARENVRGLLAGAQTDYERERFSERLGRLCGGVAVIWVGGSTETEMRERKMRVEDAVGAVRAALAGGVVPGAGTAYIRAVPAVRSVRGLDEDGMTGVRLVESALEAPLRTLAANAGEDGGVVVGRVSRSRGNVGWDMAGGAFRDLLAAGVADPAAVVVSALRNAASAAGMLLTTECAMPFVAGEGRPI